MVELSRYRGDRRASVERYMLGRESGKCRVTRKQIEEVEDGVISP